MITEHVVAEFLAGGDAAVRTRTMVVNAGTPVLRYDWMTDTEYYLKLSTQPDHVRLARLKGAPLLANHWRMVENTIGVIESAWLDGSKLMATARFAETPDVEDIWQKISDGILRNVSVEAFVMETKDITKKDDKIKTLMAIDWEPQAVAVVPVGADPKAQFLAAIGGERECQRLRSLAEQVQDSTTKGGTPAVADKTRAEIVRVRLGLRIRAGKERAV